MNNIKITTITPVHIGSGVAFQGDFEYLFFEKEGQVVVLDAAKVLQLLGEENMGHWLSCIDQGKPLLPVLQQRRQNLVPDDVALRTLPVRHGGLAGKNTLRENLHSGSGQPLLPGSSLKGSVRTALFADFINRAQGKPVKSRHNLLNRKNQFDDKSLIKQCFGDDPNHDILRLLQIGDAHFEKTACFRSDTINLRRDEWENDKRFTQFIEALPAGSSATMAFHFDETLALRAESKRHFPQNVGMLRPQNLFQLLNQHTSNLARREAEWWREKEGSPAVLGEYIDKLELMAEAANTCQVGECILRLGWGSGFRNMTGDWHIHMTDDDYYDLILKLRPRHPEDLPYPKSTRMLAGGEPLGYAKLELL